ncbi:uncharacterized protein LOC129727934 isoform X2 [Wyeomyia smithii]|uniref:uncharacterized protein LOC129727934 isoform X2 n=1 Tax=Wyeomyia smithii TaxID=174621 RepID=UPI002467BBB7|nr:uncharacterized protein LOC129727934 isoform X2 [Wyeomyia smithii]
MAAVISECHTALELDNFPDYIRQFVQDSQVDPSDSTGILQLLQKYDLITLMRQEESETVFVIKPVEELPSRTQDIIFPKGTTENDCVKRRQEADVITTLPTTISRHLEAGPSTRNTRENILGPINVNVLPSPDYSDSDESIFVKEALLTEKENCISGDEEKNV